MSTWIAGGQGLEGAAVFGRQHLVESREFGLDVAAVDDDGTDVLGQKQGVVGALPEPGGWEHRLTDCQLQELDGIGVVEYPTFGDGHDGLSSRGLSVVRCGVDDTVIGYGQRTVSPRAVSSPA